VGCDIAHRAVEWSGLAVDGARKMSPCGRRDDAYPSVAGVVG
jgi:hypothetical protein